MISVAGVIHQLFTRQGWVAILSNILCFRINSLSLQRFYDINEIYLACSIAEEVQLGGHTF